MFKKRKKGSHCLHWQNPIKKQISKKGVTPSELASLHILHQY